MPVSGNDLCRDLLPVETERVHHPGFDRRRSRGIGPDRAGELADPAGVDGFPEPFEVPVGLEGEAGQPQSESRRLGVDPVGPPDAERVPEFEGPFDQSISICEGPLDQDLTGRTELDGQGRVEHVRRGQSVMDPPAFITDRGGNHVDERGDVMVGDLLTLVDRLDREGCLLPTPLRVFGRNDALGYPCLRGCQLDREPGVELRLGSPDRPHHGAGVAPDQGRTPGIVIVFSVIASFIPLYVPVRILPRLPRGRCHFSSACHRIRRRSRHRMPGVGRWRRPGRGRSGSAPCPRQ